MGRFKNIGDNVDLNLLNGRTVTKVTGDILEEAIIYRVHLLPSHGYTWLHCAMTSHKNWQNATKNSSCFKVLGKCRKDVVNRFTC